MMMALDFSDSASQRKIINLVDVRSLLQSGNSMLPWRLSSKWSLKLNTVCINKMEFEIWHRCIPQFFKQKWHGYAMCPIDLFKNRPLMLSEQVIEQNWPQLWFHVWTISNTYLVLMQNILQTTIQCIGFPKAASDKEHTRVQMARVH